MSPKGFIRSEDLKEARLEAFPYFPVDRNLGQGADTDEDETSIAQVIGGADQPPKTAEQRIVDRLQEAEQQAQEIARKAYEEGFASGEAEGRTFGESQYQAYIQRLEAHFRDLAAASLTLREALNEELIALALAVGEYLALQQMDQSPEAVKALMERVLDELPFPLPRGHREGEQPFQAFLNPADLEQLGDRYIGHGGLALAPDASLSRGSVRLEAPQGILDASLERRRAHLMGLMARLKEEAQP